MNYEETLQYLYRQLPEYQYPVTCPFCPCPRHCKCPCACKQPRFSALSRHPFLRPDSGLSEWLETPYDAAMGDSS